MMSVGYSHPPFMSIIIIPSDATHDTKSPMQPAFHSQTSDSGPSEIGTRYLQRMLLKVPNNWFAYMVLIHFEPPRIEDNLSTKDLNLYCSQIACP